MSNNYDGLNEIFFIVCDSSLDSIHGNKIHILFSNEMEKVTQHDAPTLVYKCLAFWIADAVKQTDVNVFFCQLCDLKIRKLTMKITLED